MSSRVWHRCGCRVKSWRARLSRGSVRIVWAVASCQFRDDQSSVVLFGQSGQVARVRQGPAPSRPASHGMLCRVSVVQSGTSSPSSQVELIDGLSWNVLSCQSCRVEARRSGLRRAKSRHVMPVVSAHVVSGCSGSGYGGFRPVVPVMSCPARPVTFRWVVHASHAVRGRVQYAPACTVAVSLSGSVRSSRGQRVHGSRV